MGRRIFESRSCSAPPAHKPSDRGRGTQASVRSCRPVHVAALIASARRANRGLARARSLSGPSGQRTASAGLGISVSLEVVPFRGPLRTARAGAGVRMSVPPRARCFRELASPAYPNCDASFLLALGRRESKLTPDKSARSNRNVGIQLAPTRLSHPRACRDHVLPRFRSARGCVCVAALGALPPPVHVRPVPPAPAPPRAVCTP